MLKSNRKNDLSEVRSVRSVAGLNWTGKLYRPSDYNTHTHTHTGSRSFRGRIWRACVTLGGHSRPPNSAKWFCLPLNATVQWTPSIFNWPILFSPIKLVLGDGYRFSCFKMGMPLRRLKNTMTVSGCGRVSSYGFLFTGKRATGVMFSRPFRASGRIKNHLNSGPFKLVAIGGRIVGVRGGSTDLLLWPCKGCIPLYC